ncbi:MAG: TRAP transporter small permease subunit [Gammaproteobacteria bacterium]|nr:TRAP transporter small permease subunit [Gammaproteobacteria bacterium]
MDHIATVLERVNRIVGRTVAWFTLAMVLVTFTIVVLRYLFDLGWIWLQESVTWMHAAVFMLAAGYTLTRDEHVRVDVFYRDLSARARAAIDAAGSLLFLIPFNLFLLFGSWQYVANSWTRGETSPEAGGLIYPAIPLLKSFIPVAALLLLLQAVVVLLRSALRISGHGESASGTERAKL